MKISTSLIFNQAVSFKCTGVLAVETLTLAICVYRKITLAYSSGGPAQFQLVAIDFVHIRIHISMLRPDKQGCR